MATRPRQTESDDAAGAPEWMVTFSDCMTLLLTFFVLLLSFSSFDNKVFIRMESSFEEGLASLGLSLTKNRDALDITPIILPIEEPEAGSDKPTVDGQHASNVDESLDFLNFQNQRVFLLPSDKVFLGMGLLMSAHGREILADMGALLKAVSNRVVISEHPIPMGSGSDEIGLERAWEMIRFITAAADLDKTRFSISAAGTMPEDRLLGSGLLATRPRTRRVIEIVILERSTYR